MRIEIDLSDIGENFSDYLPWLIAGWYVLAYVVVMMATWKLKDDGDGERLTIRFMAVAASPVIVIVVIVLGIAYLLFELPGRRSKEPPAETKP